MRPVESMNKFLTNFSLNNQELVSTVVPSHRVAYIVVNCSYRGLRGTPEFESFEDLPQSEIDQEIKCIQAGLQGIGYRPQDIIVLKDADYIVIQSAFTQM